MTLRHFFLALGAAATVTVSASDYATIAAKAQRFYANREWASASAMYSLLIDERPTEAWLYGHAIVADGMRGSEATQIELMKEAIAHRVPLDSVFSAVETLSFAQGRAHIYEHFLLNLRVAEPWLQRAVDGRLLKFYAFRRNPAETERYAEIMLRGLPDSEEFLYTLAGAYVTADELDKAVEVYRKITELNPRAYVALLYLGNRAADTGDRAAATEWLSRAAAIKSTPYVDRRLKEMENEK